MEDKSQDKKKAPKLTPPKGPKFNIYWVYGIIALILIGVQFFPFTRSSELISFEEFNHDMLQAEDVAKLEVVNKEYVEVFIKEDRLQQEKYKDVRSTNFSTVNPGPHYRFKILSVDDFTKKLSEAEAQIKLKNPEYQPVEVYPENRNRLVQCAGLAFTNPYPCCYLAFHHAKSNGWSRRRRRANFQFWKIKGHFI